MRLFVTGSSGFVGKNLCSYFETQFSIYKFERDTDLLINADVVIHLAGKAHDFKNTSNPELYYQANTELAQKVFDAFFPLYYLMNI
jgi:nucleoside-diphosphate-sugar epimerase